MNKMLPPLNGLRAFEAAARLQSFKQAAEELNVTPAAISQQIRQLEQHLGAALFVRTTRALELSPRGRRAFPLVKEAFDRLHAAAREMRGAPEEDVLTVSLTATFGTCWLLPRLERFRRAHPEFNVRIDASSRFADFRSDGVDIAIRCGRGTYEGLTSELLMSDVAFVACSPRLLDGGRPLNGPEELAGRDLLHVDWIMEAEAQPSWARWKRHHGITGLDVEGGMRFTMEDMGIRAAIAGMGFSMVTRAFVIDDLAEGRLVRALPERYDMPTVFHHYVVYPPLRNGRPQKVAMFRDWLIEEARASDRASAPKFDTSYPYSDA
jgi:LysR family glycine cleavage system transcriptional activator